jgi:non-ribosomal peptide synthetase component F
MDVEVAVTGLGQRMMPAAQSGTTDREQFRSEDALLTEEELRQLVEWNTTESVFPRDSCVHDLVAAQAERTPNATAVSDSQGSLSYATLSDRSGRLARHLRLLGVGPDLLVGVCLRRSIDMVVAQGAARRAGVCHRRPGQASTGRATRARAALQPLPFRGHCPVRRHQRR